MAAIAEAPLADLVALRHLSGADLGLVLEEETRSWQKQLDWDFRPAADLVTRFVDLQSLSGYAMVVGSRVIGYSYYVCEGHKGLIGDLYVMERYRSFDNENRVLTAVLRELMETPLVKRIESQLMMLRAGQDRPLPYPRHVTVYPRQFMVRRLRGSNPWGVTAAAGEAYFEMWRDARCDEASRLIEASYVGHIDSEINDQYRSAAGARKFLMNIVQYPGCGSFFQPGSFLAYATPDFRLAGMILGSMVASDAGHVTQVCVAPELRGLGLASELIRRSLTEMEAYGCRMASLTVTTANERAIRLYEHLGFSTERRFAAHVWSAFS